MFEKVLFVDDEPNVLEAVKRQLRKKNFMIKVALGGDMALEVMKKEGPIAVIVSDMRMPEMDGIKLLARVKDLYPDTVRMMLTGNADQETAMEAVNQGSIFRFLTKPCAPDLLANSVDTAIEQHRLITAEKELLNKTLNGSIKVMSEILSLVNPAAFSRSYRIKNYVKEIAVKLKLRNLWQFQIAALLSQIGCITLPTDTINKVYEGKELDKAEKKMYDGHPAAGAKLLVNIPRFKIISKIIEMQMLPYSAFKAPAKDANEKTAFVGAQILHLAIDYDQLIFLGRSHKEACEILATRGGEHNPHIMAALVEMDDILLEKVIHMITAMSLQTGMVVNQDVKTRTGILIASRGQEVSATVLDRLRNFANTVGVVEPFEVIEFRKRKL
ncbi:MAG: response regulator [Desulfobulbaceae bacterium]|uniref:Response regulator n=1 Tax=Candidatus Desulfobia pelagia TaxID=2841692 RepID=A0A8J6NFQ8_9BACT|nr:response regulator [Candidatus Desulfobia pelagia]